MYHSCSVALCWSWLVCAVAALVHVMVFAIFFLASIPTINPLPYAGSAEADSSQQNGSFPLDVNICLPSPLLPTSLTSDLPPRPDNVSADLSAPLPMASSSWTSFDSPLPGNFMPDSSMPDPVQPITKNWGETGLGGLDSDTSQVGAIWVGAMEGSTNMAVDHRANVSCGEQEINLSMSWAAAKLQNERTCLCQLLLGLKLILGCMSVC